MDIFFKKNDISRKRIKSIIGFGDGGSNGAYNYSTSLRDFLRLPFEAGALTVTGNSTITGTFGVTGNTTVTGTFGVTGNSTLTGNATITGTLGAGATTLASASVTGNATVSGNLLAGRSEVVLGALIGANMNITTDQPITISRIGTRPYLITRIVATNASVSLTTAAGGIYTAATKGGTAIVAAAQVYTALNAASKALNLTLAVNETYTLNALQLSLTTAQGAAATADFYVFGIIL